MAPARCLVDDPLGTMHEAQVLSEVLAKIGEAGKRYAVPETAAPFAPEESLSNNPGNGVVGCRIVRELGGVCLHCAEALKSSLLSQFCVRDDARVRPCVDEHAARREDSVNLA